MMRTDTTTTATAAMAGRDGRHAARAWAWALSLALAVSLLPSCRPNDQPDELALASQALVDGRYAEVLTLTEQVLRRRPDDLDALLLNSYCLQLTATDRGARSKAIFNLDRATTLAPLRHDVWYVYGWVLYDNARYDDAFKALGKAEALLLGLSAPTASERARLADVMFLLGRCCMHNNLPKGLTYFQGLRRYEPYRQWPELYNSMAILSLKQGLYSNALGWLGEGLRFEPDNASLLRNVAVVYDIYLANPRLARAFYVRCLGALSPEAAGAAGTREQIMRRLRQLPVAAH